MQRLSEEDKQDKLARVAASIKGYPNFPKEGVLFRDVFATLQDVQATRDLLHLFYDRYVDLDVDVFVGIDSRGFIFGSQLALLLGKRFVPVRKAGKLPGRCRQVEYSLEYGTDRLEIQEGSVGPGDRVVVIDDLIATGGTMLAACRLVEEVGATVVETACVVELPELGGRQVVDKYPLFVLTQFGDSVEE